MDSQSNFNFQDIFNQSSIDTNATEFTIKGLNSGAVGLNQSGNFVNIDTDELPEGKNNLYYTDTRVQNVISNYTFPIINAESISSITGYFDYIAERTPFAGIQVSNTINTNQGLHNTGNIITDELRTNVIKNQNGDMSITATSPYVINIDKVQNITGTNSSFTNYTGSTGYFSQGISSTNYTGSNIFISNSITGTNSSFTNYTGSNIYSSGIFTGSTGHFNSMSGNTGVFNTMRINTSQSFPNGIRFFNGTNNRCMRMIESGFADVYIGHLAGPSSDLNGFHTGIGDRALSNMLSSARSNTAIGWYSGNSLTTGSGNTLIGRSCGANILTGGSNTMVGSSAGQNLSFGSANNVAIGDQALSGGVGSTISNCVAIGRLALRSLTSGADNICISGFDSSTAITTGSRNIVMGTLANYLGNYSDNVLIGTRVLQTAGGNQNTVIGSLAGQNNSGAGNVFLGYSAGQNSGSVSNKLIIANTNTITPLIDGDFSQSILRLNCAQVNMGISAGTISQGTEAIAIGRQSAYNNQGIEAISIGKNAGYNTQGTQAIAIGTDAGNNIQGLNGIAIGYQAGQFSQGSYAIAIGYKAGLLNQPEKSIVLNSNDTNLTPANSGFYVHPIRQDNTISRNPLAYTTQKEIVQTDRISVSSITGSTGYFTNVGGVNYTGSTGYFTNVGCVNITGSTGFYSSGISSVNITGSNGFFNDSLTTKNLTVNATGSTGAQLVMEDLWNTGSTQITMKNKIQGVLGPDVLTAMRLKLDPTAGSNKLLFQYSDDQSTYTTVSSIDQKGEINTDSSIISTSATGLISLLPTGKRTATRCNVQFNTLGNNPCDLDLRHIETGDFYRGWQISARGSGDTNQLHFYFNNPTSASGPDGYLYTLRGSISSTDGVYTSFSDARLKRDIEPLNYGLNELLQLQPRRYKIKDDNTCCCKIGFIAQEVLPIVPESVVESKGEDNFLMMNYATLVPVLTNSIKELNSKIEMLGNRLSLLE